MEYATLGRTGIKVSRIGLGTMTWGRQNTENEGHEQLDYALDAGINFIDTAEMYPVPPQEHLYAVTETIIGNWIAARKNRDKFVLATKIAGIGIGWVRGGTEPISGKAIPTAVDASLKRLQTDYIDLYQLHWPNRASYSFGNVWNFQPANIPLAEVEANFHDCLLALDALVKAGKIRAVGLSNETAWGTMQWLRQAEKHGLPRMASIQNEYSLLDRIFDLDLAEVALYEDVGLLAWSPLATGILTGKYLNGQLPEGSRRTLGNRHNHRLHPLVDVATQRYLDIAAKYGLDPAQMAIAFTLAQPFVTSSLIGATSMAQLKTDIAAKDVKLDAAVLADIGAVYRELPRPF